MSVETLLQNYRTLHSATLWRLLSADTAPEILACLQTLLFDNERVLKTSVTTARLEALLNQINPMSVTREEALGKLADWRKRGFLVTHFAPGDDEPSYELSVAAYEAIRFIDSQTIQRTAPTGSRLELVTHAIVKLADDTNENVAARIERLELEKRRIDQRIQSLKNGVIDEISEMEIRSELDDIVQMLDALDGDFLRVRDRFRELADQIHEKVMQNQFSSDEMLGRFFKGYDAIDESEEGKTFKAFYRFLCNDIAIGEIDSAISSLGNRPFWQSVAKRSQNKITDMRRSLNIRARETQSVMRRLSISLKHLVQSRDYVRNKRLKELLAQAQQLALELAQNTKIPYNSILIEETESTVNVNSSQAIALYDPASEAIPTALENAQRDAVNILDLAKRLNASEINYALLKKHIIISLGDKESVSIGEVLKRFPATQGLASVIGYLHLAFESEAVEDTQHTERIHWEDRFQHRIYADLPIFYFTQDSVKQLGFTEETIRSILEAFNTTTQNENASKDSIATDTKP